MSAERKICNANDAKFREPRLSSWRGAEYKTRINANDAKFRERDGEPETRNSEPETRNKTLINLKL